MRRHRTAVAQQRASRATGVRVGADACRWLPHDQAPATAALSQGSGELSVPADPAAAGNRPEGSARQPESSSSQPAAAAEPAALVRGLI
jgi:hypothetical protein